MAFHLLFPVCNHNLFSSLLLSFKNTLTSIKLNSCCSGGHGVPPTPPFRKEWLILGAVGDGVSRQPSACFCSASCPWTCRFLAQKCASFPEAAHPKRLTSEGTLRLSSKLGQLWKPYQLQTSPLVWALCSCDCIIILLVFSFSSISFLSEICVRVCFLGSPTCNSCYSAFSVILKKVLRLPFVAGGVVPSSATSNNSCTISIC